MSEINNVPKLRFPQFSEPWEPYKVSDITLFHKQGFYTTEKYDDSKKYYLLRGTDLSGNKVVLKDTPKINATYKDFEAFKTQIGDFLIVRSGTVGTYGIVYEEIPAIFGSYLIDFRFNKELITNEFFGNFYQSNYFKKQLHQIIQRSANTNINAENIKSVEIKLPCLKEQIAIGNFHDLIDKVINLNEEKYDSMLEYKKAMLQKMFPKDGEAVPEIRFPGFEGEWEEHELSEMFNYEQPTKYIVKNDNYEGCTKYPVLTANKGFILGYTNEIDGVYDKGDVIIFDDFTCDHKFVNFSFKVKSSAIKFLTSKENFDLWFLSELLGVINQQPLSHQRHWLSVMQPLMVFVPVLEEQQKIGSFFKALNEQIDLQKQKIELIKEYKKGLLQQMFI